VIFIERDHCGITTYMVCNDAGICLIRTTSSRIAFYVESHVHGVDPSLRLTIGGDPGAKIKRSLWTHVRRFQR
jgi:hypothetical protein